MNIDYAISVCALCKDRAKEQLAWRPNFDIGVGQDIVSKVVFQIIFEVILGYQLHNPSELVLVSFIQAC